MKNKKYRMITYIIAACNLLTAAVLYPSLPDQIPMQWGSDGSVNYNDKIQLFAMCGMAVAFAILFDILPNIDPRKKNYQKFGIYYDGFCVFMQLFMYIMTGIILVETFRPGTVSVPMVTMILVGLLFLFIGNIMPKIKSNFYMGIKTPWALSSDEVWRKTHRLGGKCFFFCGILMIVTALFSSSKTVYHVTMLIILIACFIPGIMSYVWWRQEQKS